MSSLRLPPKEYALLVKQVLSRDGYKCRSCFSRNALHVHHIVFRSQQGPDEMWNLVTLCSSCHRGIHVDVQNGEYGLVIETPQNGVIRFRRAPWWRPA